MCGHWRGPAVRPAEIGFGAHYDVANIHWWTWSRTTAYGRGHYYGFGSYRARIKLYRVRLHNGRHFFSRIRIRASGHPTRYLAYYSGTWHTLS